VGEDIPIPAVIIAIADTLDAITSDRSYRKAADGNTATEKINRCSGKKYGPMPWIHSSGRVKRTLSPSSRAALF
jgi:response regulator RpfG family c-di-GMP phosphodiesterase